MSARLLTLGGGFLLAVLWFDLMFDVQVAPYPDVGAPLPEPVLASIAGYYRRVTTEAFPMNRAVAVVMVATIGGSLWQVWRGPRHAMAALALLLVSAPIALAALRVFPNAVRLATRADTAARQSELARSIYLDHLWCLAAIVLFTAIQLCGLAGASPAGRRR